MAPCLSHPGPVFVEVGRWPGCFLDPPHITEAQVKGFAPAAGKIVLNGGVGKMLELARTNLRQRCAPLAMSSLQPQV